MTDFDRRIAGALDAEDEAFLKRLDDGRGLFAQMGDTLTGPLGGWTRLVFVLSALLGVLMFYSLYRVLTAEDTRQTVLWCSAGLATLMMQAATKQWLFDRINLNAVLRELKRIELRVARIEERN